MDEENEGGEYGSSAEVVIAKVLPHGWSIKDILFIESEGEKDQIHFLLTSNDTLQHMWFVDSGGPKPVHELSKKELVGVISNVMDMMVKGGTIDTREGKKVVFQSFRKDKLNADLDYSVLREEGKIFFRGDSGDTRYILEYETNPDPMEVSGYAVSRLNSQNFPYVHDIIGITYWDMDRFAVPWARLYRTGSRVDSAFSPFLADLDQFTGRLLDLEPSKLRKYLFLLSHRKEMESVKLCNLLGRTLGMMQSKLFIKEVRSSKNRKDLGHRIAEELSIQPLTMEEVGTLLGTISSYLTYSRKQMTKSYGKPAEGGISKRKLKVVKRSASDPMEVLSRSMVEREGHIREIFSSLRGMAESPSVNPLVDCRLERMEFDGRNFFLGRFDWSPPGLGNGIILPPLKDLAMVLNSLLKCRLLSVKKTLRKISSIRGFDNRTMESLFMDYNLSKGNYDAMRRDLLLPNLVGDRGSPMSTVVVISIGSALWFELCRNSLVEGYNIGVEESQRYDLLEYPPGLDTSKGLLLMQAFMALSGAVHSLREGRGRRSDAGLESDLLTLLTSISQL